jgi:hypothetical protein
MFAYLILRLRFVNTLCNFMRDIPSKLTVFFMTVGQYKSSWCLRSILRFLELDQKDRANNDTQLVVITVQLKFLLFTYLQYCT